MPVLGVIPARLGSSRLPRKPLQPLGGKPLVVRVWERVCGLALLDEVVVATDAPEVHAVVERAGGRAALTSPLHESGTERVAEIARRPDFARFDLILNLQGDEPFLSPLAVRGALARLAQGDDVGTAASPLAADDADDPSRVKVVMDDRGRALYFSRARIPAVRDPVDAELARYWQHVGIYGYTRDALVRWVTSPPVMLEQVERLEQLRALAAGLRVGVAQLADACQPGVDTPEDLDRAEQHWINALATEGTTR